MLPHHKHTHIHMRTNIHVHINIRICVRLHYGKSCMPQAHITTPLIDYLHMHMPVSVCMWCANLTRLAVSCPTLVDSQFRCASLRVHSLLNYLWTHSYGKEAGAKIPHATSAGSLHTHSCYFCLKNCYSDIFVLLVFLVIVAVT